MRAGLVWTFCFSSIISLSFSLSLGDGPIWTEILSQSAVKPKTTNQPTDLNLHLLPMSDLNLHRLPMSGLNLLRLSMSDLNLHHLPMSVLDLHRLPMSDLNLYPLRRLI